MLLGRSDVGSGLVLVALGAVRGRGDVLKDVRDVVIDLNDVVNDILNVYNDIVTPPNDIVMDIGTGLHDL